MVDEFIEPLLRLCLCLNKISRIEPYSLEPAPWPKRRFHSQTLELEEYRIYRINASKMINARETLNTRRIYFKNQPAISTLKSLKILNRFDAFRIYRTFDSKRFECVSDSIDGYVSRGVRNQSVQVSSVFKLLRLSQIT